MPALPTRQLGIEGPMVTALGFGCMGLSAFYGAPESDEKRFEVLDRAYELGLTFWDSADVYQDNEDLIGKWFKRTGRRGDIFLTTKFGYQLQGDKMVPVTTPEYVKEACDRSLKRLGVNQIDLYYCHRLDGKTPIEKTVQAMVELKQAGKIEYLGLSEVSATSLRRACAIHPIAAVQMEYSPFALDIESPRYKLLETCRELGVATVAYSPLGTGFITGRYKSRDDFEEGDVRRYIPRFNDENFGKNLKLVEQIAELARKKGCTPSQLTLAWLLAQGDDIIPIPGTKKIKYLEENLGGLTVQLTDSEVSEMRSVVDAAGVYGLRFPEEYVKYLFSESPPLVQ